jgi:hypothetical protein
VLLLLLPLQDPSHRVENASNAIMPTTRMLPSARRREPTVNAMPSSPGNRTAYRMPVLRPSGRTAAEDGAVVVTVKLTETCSVGKVGPTHVTPLTVDGTTQLYVTGTNVCWFGEVPVRNDVGPTANVTLPFCPCVSCNWPLPRLEVREKVTVVWVTFNEKVWV